VFFIPRCSTNILTIWDPFRNHISLQFGHVSFATSWRVPGSEGILEIIINLTCGATQNDNDHAESRSKRIGLLYIHPLSLHLWATSFGSVHCNEGKTWMIHLSDSEAPKKHLPKYSKTSKDNFETADVHFGFLKRIFRLQYDMNPILDPSRFRGFPEPASWVVAARENPASSSKCEWSVGRSKRAKFCGPQETWYHGLFSMRSGSKGIEILSDCVFFRP